MNLKILFLLSFLLSGLPGFSQTPSLENPVTEVWLRQHLVRESPRLILNPGVLKNLKEKIKSDSTCRMQYQQLSTLAESFVRLPDFQRTMEGRRILDVSRDAIRRLSCLSMVYRISGDKRFLQRVERDLRMISAFQDWNPGHFLDVAEMTLAVSLAVDWCGKYLSPSVRKLAMVAVKRHILFSFEEKKENINWWINGENNWNQVCHGGMLAGVLLLADEEPELAAKVISRALDNIPKAMGAYAPAGAYVEGPSYWTYGTSYTVMTSSLLESVFGKDFGISKLPGLMESAPYRLLMNAPSGTSFNYFDAWDRGLGKAEFSTLAWFALKTGDRLFMPWQVWKNSRGEEENRFATLALIWSAAFRETKNSSLPTAWAGPGPNPLVVFRSGETGFYLAAKGGSGDLHHANLDGGSFVFETRGIRWAQDPGNQEYNGLEQVMGNRLWDKSQTSQRWSLVTKNNFNHNTLTVNDSLHKVKGKAELVSFDEKSGSAGFDLTPLFGNTLTSAHRTFSKRSNSSLEICDSLVLNDATRSVGWTMMTTAEVQPVLGGALLKAQGKTLRLEILEPAGLQISVLSVSPPPLAWDKNIPGLKKIEVRVPAWTWKEKKGQIRILLKDAD
jgi:hypothetical protein